MISPFILGILLSLATSVSKASKSIFTKQSVNDLDEYLTPWGYRIVVTVILTTIVLLDSISLTNDPQFLLSLFISSLSYALGSLLIAKAYLISDVSIVSPLSGFVPIVTSVPAMVILHQIPSRGAFLGVCIVSLGAYILHVNEIQNGLLKPIESLASDRGAQYVALFLVVISIGPTTDTIGLRYVDPITWGLVTSTGTLILLTPVIIYHIKTTENVIPTNKRKWLAVICIGSANVLLIVLQFNAYQYIQVGYVQAIKRVSIVIVVISGKFLFNEEHIKQRLAGSIIIVLGVVLIIIFGKPM